MLYGFKRRTQECRMRHCERREWDDLTIQLNYSDLAQRRRALLFGNMPESERLSLSSVQSTSGRWQLMS